MRNEDEILPAASMTCSKTKILHTAEIVLNLLNWLRLTQLLFIFLRGKNWLYIKTGVNSRIQLLVTLPELFAKVKNNKITK